MTTGDATASNHQADVAVVIPALNPPDGLLEFVTKITQAGIGQVILINDGSRPEFDDYFASAAAIPHVTVLRHEVNRGKGAGLRTGITEALRSPNVIGVVTTDADGQHAIADVEAIAKTLIANQHAANPAVIFGSRDFTRDDIPPKSKLGNRITSRLLAILFGRYLADTQTGLRAFPRELAEQTLHIPGDRFEYEMNVLLWALTSRIPLQEVPIATIYHDATNSVSNFRPLQDAARIYWRILRQFFGFISTSLLGSLVDLLAYSFLIVIVFHQQGAVHIAISVVVARIISSLFNFVLNRKLVFGSGGSAKRALVRYYILAVAILSGSAVGTTLLGVASGGHVIWAKIIVDLALFVVSYLVQKRWVFAPSTPQPAPHAAA